MLNRAESISIDDGLANVEAEQALLGAVLVNNQAYFVCHSHIQEEYFSEYIHRIIWRLVCRRMESGGRVDAILLKSDLGSDASVKLDDIDIGKYCARLVSEATTVVNAIDYASTIADLWRVRKLSNLGDYLSQYARAGADREPVDEIIRETDAELTSIAFGRNGAQVKSLADAVTQSIDETAAAYKGGQPAGLSWGLDTIDSLCGRMQPGDLIVLLAPSHHGKTALVTQILCSLSVPSYFLEMEMNARDIARRLIARESRVKVRAQESGEVNDSEFGELVSAARSLSRLPVIIDDGGIGGQRVSSVLSRIRAMAKLRGVRAAAIDHLKLLVGDRPRQTIIEVITDAAIRLKSLAMELNIPIIALAQPTRESRKRDMSRPRVEDIYGGGVLEECADIILGLHHPCESLRQREPEPGSREHLQWLEQMTKWEGFVEIAALKRRRGSQSGWRKLAYDGPTTSFSEIDS